MWCPPCWCKWWSLSSLCGAWLFPLGFPDLSFLHWGPSSPLYVAGPPPNETRTSPLRWGLGSLHVTTNYPPSSARRGPIVTKLPSLGRKAFGSRVSLGWEPPMPCVPPIIRAASYPMSSVCGRPSCPQCAPPSRGRLSCQVYPLVGSPSCRTCPTSSGRPRTKCPPHKRS
jgi:hypothetical protein